MIAALGMVLFEWDGQTATVNPWAVVLVVALIALTWSVFK